MPTHLHTLSITFNLPLKYEHIEAFRGAIAQAAGLDDELFHNHRNDRSDQHDQNPETDTTLPSTYHQRYPLIHYRIHDGRASLMGINQGAVSIERLLRSGALKNFTVRGRRRPLEVVQRFQNQHITLDFVDEGQPWPCYRLYHYLPLTPDNYRQYKAFPTFTDRIQFLEKILANHLVAFARAVDWTFTQPLQVSIYDIDRVKKRPVLGTPMMAFDLVFTTNAHLPDRLAIGRKIAFGHGWFFRLPDSVPVQPLPDKTQYLKETPMHVSI